MPAPAPGGGPPGAEQTRVLFVCTANQCRSPLAEELARRRFADAPFVFGSAGMRAGGRPMPPTGVAVSAQLGLDMSSHRSRRLDTARLGEWDLVLTMSREHVRDLVAADEDLWPRIFTLPQFVRWLDANHLGRHARVRPWIEALAGDRSRNEMIGSLASDEVADPIDGPPAAWWDLSALLTAALDRMAWHLLPGSSDSQSHPGGDAVAEIRTVEEPRSSAARGGVRRERALHRAPKLRRVGRAE